jgi:hypothetical protein
LIAPGTLVLITFTRLPESVDADLLG